jgi:deazaflavin-dependent oxidoreductase (nitroreductase family)
VEPELPGAPAGIEAVRRHSADGRTWLFAFNHTDGPREIIAAGVDLVSGRRVEGRLTLACGDAVVLREDGFGRRPARTRQEHTPTPVGPARSTWSVTSSDVGLRDLELVEGEGPCQSPFTMGVSRPGAPAWKVPARYGFRRKRWMAPAAYAWPVRAWAGKVVGMGVAGDLGVIQPGRSPLARAVRYLASTGPGARFFSRLVPPLDAAFLRASRGRVTASEWIAGLPTVHLTTTGARSGQPRTISLAAVVVGDDLAVIGSNWGRSRHPAWVHNLAAHPHAEVARAGRRVPVTAVQATGEQAERIWQEARRLYRGFRTYPQRTGGRPIRIFVLHPDAEDRPDRSRPAPGR